MTFSNMEKIALLTNGQATTQSLLWDLELGSNLATTPYAAVALWNLVKIVAYVAIEIQKKNSTLKFNRAKNYK